MNVKNALNKQIKDIYSFEWPNYPVSVIITIIPKPTKQKKILLAEEEYQELLTYVQKHFPNTFPYNLDPLPLAISIHNQIFSIPDLPFSKMKIRKFLKIYVSKRDYRKELIVDNSRFNLDGTISSKILPEETNWLIWPKTRKESKKKNTKIKNP